MRSKLFKSLNLIALSILLSGVCHAAQSKSLPSKTEAAKKGIKPVVEESAPEPIVGGDPPTISSLDTDETKTQLAPNPFKFSEAGASRDEDEEEQNPWRLDHENPQRPHLIVGMGYVNSSWRKFSQKLNNGAIAVDVGFERKIMRSFEGGLHFTYLGSSSDGMANENVNATHVALHFRWLLMPGKLRPFAGLGVGVGNFRVWSLASNTSSSVTFNKHLSGVVVGAFPELGLRFETGAHMFFDIAGGYTGYIDHPKSLIGGANLMLRLGFQR